MISIILTTPSMFSIYNLNKANDFRYTPRSDRTWERKTTAYLHTTMDKNIDKMYKYTQIWTSSKSTPHVNILKILVLLED